MASWSTYLTVTVGVHLKLPLVATNLKDITGEKERARRKFRDTPKAAPQMG